MRRGKFIAAIGDAVAAPSPPGPSVATPGLGNPLAAEVDAPPLWHAPAGEVTG